MDAIQLLIDQHRTLEQRFDTALDEYEDQSTQRGARLAEIGDHLSVHVASEEEVFYPAVKEERTEDILLESLEEHLSLKRLLADLLALPTDDPTFKAKLKVLAEQTEHHHREEEEHLFPKVRQLMSLTVLERLGQQMCDLQRRMHRDPEEAPREAVTQETARAARL